MKSITTQDQLSKELKKKAQEEGFNPVGIATIPGSKRLKLRTAALERWLNADYQADMTWMKAPRRKNIESLLEGVQSLLVVGLNYHVNTQQKAEALSIARYAWGRDYHKVIEKRLKRIGRWIKKQRPNCHWKICVDTAPLLDKAWAEEAGIGWIGKHSNLIHPNRGSWMAIGSLLCTEPLTPDKPAKSLCGRCKACIESCPTAAISEPFVIDARRCIAYHNIENRNASIPEEIKSSMGAWVAGCDICQEACPWNQKKLPNSLDEDMIPRDWILKLTKEQALSWNDEDWNENYPDDNGQYDKNYMEALDRNRNLHSWRK